MGNRTASGPGPARDHHHVPAFYLRAWADPETGLLYESWRTPRGDLRDRPVGPKGTGYERDLYSFRSDLLGFEASRPDALEKDFFDPLDGAAARSRDKLLSETGLGALADEDRTAWALFLNSLSERHPTRLRELDAMAAEQAAATREDFLALHASDPDALVNAHKILQQIDQDAIGTNIIRRQLKTEIERPEVLAHIKSMQWSLVTSGNATLEFITGDRPLVVNMGLSATPFYSLSLAIAPTHLFLASVNELGVPERELAAAHNLRVMTQAEHRVYSRAPLEDGAYLRARRAAQQILTPKAPKQRRRK